ncbi:LytR C-terminal domain-containing protein [Alloscardovia omnicolens]|uniref:LytR C-terminal domain-containing protein n=1 Tax=Alloscardovia omnicolens TaxID=419015 RepID=UPI003A6216B5
MAHTKMDYPRDEFDAFTDSYGGAHRGKKTILARVMPFLIAVLIAALCALAFLTWTNGWLGKNGLNLIPSATTSRQISSSKKSTAKDAKKTEEKKSESTQDEKDAADKQNAQDSSRDQAQEQSQQPAAPQADKSKAVYVYNGTGITGFAASKAAVLTNDGYANVTPSNPNNASSLPSVNTVWYVNEADKVTAQDIASKLGISAVEQVSSLSSGDIAVVLIQQ